MAVIEAYRPCGAATEAAAREHSGPFRLGPLKQGALLGAGVINRAWSVLRWCSLLNDRRCAEDAAGYTFRQGQDLPLDFLITQRFTVSH